VLGTEVLAAYLSGQPEDELASWAMQEKIDLIVMATHGHGSIGRAWLGSVADRMVRKGNVPVMLIRPSESKPDVQLTPRRPFQKILIPLDGSLLAERALRKSLLVGGGAAAPEITLLTVVGFPIPMVTRGGALDSSKLGRALEDTAEVHLERMARHIAAWGCKVTTCVVTSPITWQAIVSFAETNGFDLIALATHGRGGAARLLMGSVADKVMRSSSVPTLLFHPEQIEGDAHRQMSAADAELAHSR
jgi:nucleotide-binding universal stress UspA family protein